MKLSKPQTTAGTLLKSTDLLAAVERLEGLAERWEETEVWHEPTPFLNGTIKITTGDLRDIATIVRGIQAANTPAQAPMPAHQNDE